MASACSGMSGRLQASGAGDRSSVLVSPVTLKTVTVIDCRHFGTRGEPLGVGPGLHAPPWRWRCPFGQCLHVVEVVEHQQGLLQALGGDRAAPASSSRSISGLMLKPPSMVPSSSVGRPCEISGHVSSPLATLRQELGLDLGRVVHARRYTVDEQVHQESFLARRADFQQADQFAGLLASVSGSGGIAEARRVRRHGR